jgi:glycine/D-amino acid oxidase-like deaminating enzyme
MPAVDEVRDEQIAAALADAERSPFWLDSAAAPQPCPPLDGDLDCDLVIVGGGYTGLWTALLAKELDPSRSVVLLEASTVGWAASGRNGGFCAASLTHGLENGVARFPDEMTALDRLGRRNLDEIATTVERFGIDCDFRRSGELSVATEPHQVGWAREQVEAAREMGHDAVFLDREAVRAQIRSPTYLAGAWSRDTTALVDPARLVWGLARACRELGVHIAEHTRVESLRRQGPGLVLRVGARTVRARQAVLATNAFPSPLRRLRRYVVPVYDYVLMTEPLTPAQFAAIGWQNRQGVGDMGNRFHYYRPTQDGRILWGGYDAIYRFGGRLRPAYDQRPGTFRTLARHFFQTFPQLDGVRFSHTWGGAIDTCTRFFAFQASVLDGRVACSLGYTGLGVGASRFGAQVMLDLLAARRTDVTRLHAVTSRPVPFPPEPLRYAGIQLTRRALARADRRSGRRGPWLRTLDRLGLGFDS